jgi:hypothetical protein
MTLDDPFMTLWEGAWERQGERRRTVLSGQRRPPVVSHRRVVPGAAVGPPSSHRRVVPGGHRRATVGPLSSHRRGPGSNVTSVVVGLSRNPPRDCEVPSHRRATVEPPSSHRRATVERPSSHRRATVVSSRGPPSSPPVGPPSSHRRVVPGGHRRALPSGHRRATVVSHRATVVSSRGATEPPSGPPLSQFSMSQFSRFFPSPHLENPSGLSCSGPDSLSAERALICLARIVTRCHKSMCHNSRAFFPAHT